MVGVLVRGLVGHVVLDEVGDHGDVVVTLAAGLVDADGLHSHVVLEPPCLVDVVGDEPPQTGVGLVQLLGGRAGGQVAGHLHGPRLEQEREPAAGPHGAGTVLTPCAGHVTRGMVAWMNALYWKKFRCRHTRSRLSCTGRTVSRQPVSRQWKRAPGSKPIMMRGS